jgi:hypothetical protein
MWVKMLSPHRRVLATTLPKNWMTLKGERSGLHAALML